MSNQRFSPETTVQEALASARTASNVFIYHRTACVGCYLSRFCTLAEVARDYGLSLDVLLEELEQAAVADPSNLRGVHCDETD